jgi:hypothetical protein
MMVQPLVWHPPFPNRGPTTMATYKQFRLGDLAPAQAGFGLLGPDCRSFTLLGGQHCVSLISIVYPMGGDR